MQRLLNPPGSAYRSETGGLMEALRVLTVEQSNYTKADWPWLFLLVRLVRDYHRSYYVPHNLMLIAAGKFSAGTTSLLSVVQDKVEGNLIKHGHNAGPRPQGWKRPFVETVSADRKVPTNTIQETVEFPEQDESMGELIIAFIGPPRDQYLERKVGLSSLMSLKSRARRVAFSGS